MTMIETNTLSLVGDKGILAEIDVTREGGGCGDDYAGGAVAAQGGNLYLYIDGREMGSLWITYDDDGTPKITLGQYDEESQGWEERSEVLPITGPDALAGVK
jgi:hypothetical protein